MSSNIVGSRLFKVAVFGGVFVTGACIWMEKRIQSTYRQQEFYQKPVSMLQNYKPAENFLGRPIYGGRLDLSQEKTMKIHGVEAKLTIPVTGPKNKGLLHVLASRETKDDGWNIDQLDLEIPTTNQKWKFYDRSLITVMADDSVPGTSIQS